jgi:drug/metabolite transporter (DMT)-like permease
LVHRYPVSLLHAFTFFVPVFGISISGVLMLGEVITTRLVLALGMVGLGMIMVNHRSGKDPHGRVHGTLPSR